MKSKILYYTSLFAIAVMGSCSNDNEYNSGNSGYVNSVRVTVEDFQPESPSTRTAYTVDGSGFHFQWVEGDALGIYPVGGDQVKFPISNGDGSASATFDGGAWKLRSEYQYAAYYPFSVDNYKIDQKALPVSFTGQTQNENGSTAHLGAYDYLACAATAPDANGGVDLTMKHLGAFLRLQLTMPKADTYSSVVLESDGAKFVTAGTFDLTAATPAITPTATSSIYTINLTNVATAEKNQVITVYAIVAPANLSANNIKVTVHGTGQTTYVQTVPGKNFAARSAYNIAVESFPGGTNASGEDVSWEEPVDPYNGHEYVEIGGVKWATMNVGASTIAGSYNTCCGDYYAWGETTTRYTSISRNDKSATFVWSNNHAKGYSSEDYPTYTNSVLDAAHDAATQNWGTGWRTPTKEDFMALYEACGGTGDSYFNNNGLKDYSTRVSDKGIYWCDNYEGVSGLIFCDGTNSLFFPSAGNVTNKELYRVGDASWNMYWSATRNSNNVAHVLQFYTQSGGGGIYPSGVYYTNIGYPIRAVCK